MILILVFVSLIHHERRVTWPRPSAELEKFAFRNTCLGRISPEKLGSGHIAGDKLVVVIPGLVEEFPELFVAAGVVLGVGDVEVGEPAQLPIDVALLHQLGVVGHARAFDLVDLVGVELLARLAQSVLRLPLGLIEVFLKSRLLTLKNWWFALLN